MTAPSTRPITDTTERFVLWCAEQLQMEMEPLDQAIRLTIPEDWQESLGGRSEVTFAIEAGHLDPGRIEADSAANRPPSPAPNELLDWLVGQLRIAGASHPRGVVDSRPRRQPESVHEISARLFSGYQIDSGRVHLGGCTLEDHPLVRVTTRRQGTGSLSLQHSFWTSEGRPISRALIDALQLDDLTRIDQRRNRAVEISEPAIHAIRAAARESYGRDIGLPLERVECLATTIVWCKYAEGKLRFHIGSETVELPFSDWAATLEPPPFVCPYSGGTGFHLAATDDERITLADQIQPCSVSGQRVLKSELAECQITGRSVLAKYLTTCPVTGDRLLTDHLVTCPICRQEVSPRAVEKAACRSCQRIPRISRDDPRLLRLLVRHPVLDRRYAFFLSETETCWIVRAIGVLRERLLVVDRHTLDPRYHAWKWRGTSDFRPLPLEDVS